MDDYLCAFCGRRVEDADQFVAIAWMDPHGEACIAHFLCVSVFDGLPSWPRARRKGFRWLT